MKALLKLSFSKNIIVRLFVVLLVFHISSCGIASYAADYFSTCFCYKGQWSSWDRHYFPSEYLKEYDDWRIYCSYSPEKHIIGLTLKDRNYNKYFEFYITDYSPGKKICSGYVEYYVNDTYPTAEELARADYFLKPNYRTDITPSVKRTAKAVIKIVNNERKPAVFNIWYDNIGVAFDIRGVHWR